MRIRSQVTRRFAGSPRAVSTPAAWVSHCRGTSTHDVGRPRAVHDPVATRGYRMLGSEEIRLPPAPRRGRLRRPRAATAAEALYRRDSRPDRTGAVRSSDPGGRRSRQFVRTTWLVDTALAWVSVQLVVSATDPEPAERTTGELSFV